MNSPHSSATSAAMPVYQTLLPFFPLQFSEGAWCGGSGDETTVQLYSFVSATMATPPTVTEQALRKLEDQLTCGICLDSYTEPKLLQCFHVFCKQCLERLVVRDHQGLSLHCPSCRRSTLLPPTGISGLQTAFYLNNLFEVRDAIEKVKEPQKTQCEKCEKRVATSFCRSCGQFICALCTRNPPGVERILVTRGYHPRPTGGRCSSTCSSIEKGNVLLQAPHQRARSLL